MYDVEWEAGSSRKIEWVSYGGTDNMLIEYSADNGGTWIEVSPGSASGFDWTIPVTPSETALLRIRSINRPGIADSIPLTIIPALKLIKSAASGNWSAPQYHVSL